VADYWLISNLSHGTYLVENPEGAGEHVKLAPRRLDMPVPFEFARVVILPNEGSAAARSRGEFLVFAPQHTYIDAVQLFAPGGDATIAAFPLDETAKYFLILVALCEPRLRDPGSPVLPSAPDVLARLAPLPQCTTMGRAAVNSQIEYLAEKKLRVRQTVGSAGKADWQREALVRLALNFDLVRAEHLTLLPGTS